jgi:hypothetical protein
MVMGRALEYEVVALVSQSINSYLGVEEELLGWY